MKSFPTAPLSQPGVKRHDILKLLNDQQLVEPGQLSTLIRGLGKEARVKLTIIRAGKEQQVEVTLGERIFPEQRPFFHPGHPKLDELRRRLPELRERAEDAARRIHEKTRDFRESMQELQEQIGRWRSEPANPPAPMPPPRPDQPSVQADDIVLEVGPDKRPEVRMLVATQMARSNTRKPVITTADCPGCGGKANLLRARDYRRAAACPSGAAPAELEKVRTAEMERRQILRACRR
jgi:hypothetical protein